MHNVTIYSLAILSAALQAIISPDLSVTLYPSDSHQPFVADIKGVDFVILKSLKSSSIAPILYDVLFDIYSATSKDSSHSLNNLVNKSFILGIFIFWYTKCAPENPYLKTTTTEYLL